MTNEDWKGIERRSDTAALAEVRGLKESVLSLATAVGQAMTKEEVEASIRRTRGIIVAQFLLTILTIAILGVLIRQDQGNTKTLAESNKTSIEFLQKCLPPP